MLREVNVRLERSVSYKYGYAAVAVTKSGELSKARLGLLSVSTTAEEALKRAEELVALNPGKKFEAVKISRVSYSI